MIRIEDIVEKVRRNHPQADLDLLRRAYLFSAREHKGQKRASGESYLVHPLEVANILADMRLDAVSVSTGLLHDVVEDTDVTLEDLKLRGFSSDVVEAVRLLTKTEGGADWNEGDYIEAIADNAIAREVKLADLEHNMDVGRMAEITEKDRTRLNKYLRQWRRLSGTA